MDLPKLKYIGVERFRLLGGGGGGGGGGKVYNIVGRGQGGPNSQQADEVIKTSHRGHFDVMCPLGL